MKRTLSLVLALVMVLGTFTGVFAAAVEVDTAADFLEDKGVLLGDANGNLMLNKNLERRDAVVLLSRLLGVESEAKTFLTTEDSPSWEDAREDAYYVPFFAWAEENGYFAGDDEGNFNPRNTITAQEYALVLARALDYDLNGHEPWAAALAIAEELGLLEGVEVEDKDEVVRGDMAVMTYNTLGAKMNGSDQTLAEKLGIEMPAEPKPENLEVEVYTENLKEVVVELNDASLVDEEDLLDDANYKIVKNSVDRVTLDGNKVIVELNKALEEEKGYELIIGGIDKDINGRYKFTAEDDVAPAVEEVEVLGEYGIKVVTSEPISSYAERNFLVDGKNIAMNVETYGRVIILTPYHSASFPTDAEELEIRELTDYNGFKSSVQTFDIEVVKDEVAPEVEKIEMISDNVIEVTFDKDIYEDSVTGYVSTRVEGNVSYGQGRQTIFSQRHSDGDYGVKVDTNKAVYTFEERLPRNVEITVEGVQNHSKVEMEVTTERAVEKIDNRQPVILDIEFKKVNDTEARFDLYFDKDVVIDEDEVEILAGNEFATDDENYYFDVYVDSVAKRNLQDVGVTLRYYDYDEDKYDDYDEIDAHNIIRVNVTGLQLNLKPDYEYEYILEIKNFEDNSILNNRMYVDYFDFELKKGADDFVIEDITTRLVGVNTEFRIDFSEAVDRTIAEDRTNYIFETATGTKKKDVSDLKGRIIVENNGERVTLVIPTKELNDYQTGRLTILEVLKDKNGERLGDRVVYNIASQLIETNIDYTLGKVGEDFIVTPKAGVNEIVLNTTKAENFVINGNLAKLTINAPNADVEIPVDVTVDEIVIIAIKDSTLTINGTVNKIVIETSKLVNIVADNTTFGLVSAVSNANVKLNTAAVVLVKDEAKVITVTDGVKSEESENAAEKAKLVTKIADAKNSETFKNEDSVLIAEVAKAQVVVENTKATTKDIQDASAALTKAMAKEVALLETETVMNKVYDEAALAEMTDENIAKYNLAIEDAEASIKANTNAFVEAIVDRIKVLIEKIEALLPEEEGEEA